MRKLILLALLLFSLCVSAQENLLNMISENSEPVYISYFFKGTKVVNGQSVELPGKGILQFNIQHRFGTLNSGLYNLYGLDFAQVRLSLDYGITDWISVSFGRSSSIKTIDLSTKIKLKRQVKDGFPFAVVLNFASYLKQWQDSQAQKERFVFTNQLSYTKQILIARKINRSLTLQFTPTIVHYNLVEIKNEPNDKYSLGVGARQKLTKRISVNTEYFYQLNDKRTNNVLSLGFDIETGGHIFQLHLSNSSAMIDSEFITKTSGDLLQGDVYFGFNISRVFKL
jgi:opacity protein-like surface antigen